MQSAQAQGAMEPAKKPKNQKFITFEILSIIDSLKDRDSMMFRRLQLVRESDINQVALDRFPANGIVTVDSLLDEIIANSQNLEKNKIECASNVLKKISCLQHTINEEKKSNQDSLALAELESTAQKASRRLLYFLSQKHDVPYNFSSGGVSGSSGLLAPSTAEQRPVTDPGYLLKTESSNRVRATAIRGSSSSSFFSDIPAPLFIAGSALAITIGAVVVVTLIKKFGTKSEQR